jgi:hypothetical protein
MNRRRRTGVPGATEGDADGSDIGGGASAVPFGQSPPPAKKKQFHFTVEVTPDGGVDEGALEGLRRRLAALHVGAMVGWKEGSVVVKKNSFGEVTVHGAFSTENRGDGDEVEEAVEAWDGVDSVSVTRSVVEFKISTQGSGGGTGAAGALLPGVQHGTGGGAGGGGSSAGADDIGSCSASADSGASGIIIGTAPANTSAAHTRSERRRSLLLNLAGPTTAPVGGSSSTTNSSSNSSSNNTTDGTGARQRVRPPASPANSVLQEAQKKKKLKAQRKQERAEVGAFSYPASFNRLCCDSWLVGSMWLTSAARGMPLQVSTHAFLGLHWLRVGT